MLLYVLKLNQNAKMPEAYGKYYAYPVITQTVGIDGLAEHMASHNTPFSKGAIKGMITDMVSCIKELTLQGFAVKIDDLAIFSIGIRNKEGATSEKEFTIAKNIEGFRLRARGTGEFSAKTINLEATLKKASALLGDGTTPDATPDTTPDTGKATGKDTPRRRWRRLRVALPSSHLKQEKAHRQDAVRSNPRAPSGMSSSLTIQHCQIIALNGYLLILPASSLLSPTRISRISRIFFVASNGSH